MIVRRSHLCNTDNKCFQTGCIVLVLLTVHRVINGGFYYLKQSTDDNTKKLITYILMNVRGTLHWILHVCKKEWLEVRNIVLTEEDGRGEYS